MTLSGIPSVAACAGIARTSAGWLQEQKTYATELNFRALLDEEASEVELALV
jgi:hypothetical protein